MERLPTISVHLDCTACRGTGFIDGDANYRCHCNPIEPCVFATGPVPDDLQALIDGIAHSGDGKP